MRGGGIASTLSARRLDLEEDDAPSKAVSADKADTGVKGQLYKPGRKGDVEVLSGKALVEKIHEQLAQAQKNGANYCNLLWFILYVGLYVIILGMQRSPPEAFMVEESIKNSLFGESTRTVEYSTGEISTTMESSSHIFEWLENSVIKSIFVDPTCGDGICDTPLEYPQWQDYGCSEDCGTYSSKLTSTVVVNVTAAFEDDEEIEDASWNLCSTTHDVCYFSSSQLFTTRNESQVHEVELLDGVWEVQLKALRGGIVGQIYTESSQLVTVAEIVNGTIGGNETSDSNYTDTFVEYYTYVNTTRTIIAEWTACKDTSDSVSQMDLQLIQQSCEDATGEVKRICSAEDCEACSEAKCSLYADCAFNDTLGECYTLTCGNEPQACPYCADEDTCEANADCIWDESCKALCSVSDCASEACTVSQHACDVYSGGLCFWEGTGDTPCRTATDEEKCEYSCATCTQSLCEENPVCTFYRSECLDVSDVVQTDSPSTSPTTFPTAAPTLPPTPRPTQTTGGAPSQSTLSPTFGTSCTDDCTLCSDSDACFASPAACAWTGSACREEVDMSQYTCDDACHACDYSDCTSTDRCYWSDGACYPESGLCETDCASCANPAKCRRRDSFCEFSSSCIMLELCVNACEYCFSENECAFHPECVWDGLACAEASCSNTCSLCDEKSACTAQDGCSWTSLLGLGSCADESRRRELQTEVCGSMSTCEACSDDPTMCEKKSGCEFDYQSWLCSGFQEITASCDEASGGFCTSALLQNGFCDDECNIGECGYDQGACADTSNLLTYICSDMCYCNMLADDVCDAACDTAACGFDLGDCCERVFTSELDMQFELWNHFTPETVERLTPDPLLPRSRYLATVNRLIGGVLVLQTRYERGNCSSQRFAALANDCFTGEQSTAPFGADPVFLRSSSLNTDEAVYKSKSSYYNLSDLEQVSTLGLPYGFHFFAASSNLSAGGSIEGFPVYFDANLGSTRASEFLAYMQEGFYLDADTESVDVLMVTYNAALRMFANTRVTFSFEYGGRVRMAYTVQSFRAEPYATDADLTRLFFETVFVILTALNFVSELRDFFRDFWRTGKPLTYFKSLWNYVDMVNIWLLVWNVISWTTFFTTWTLQYDPKERYNVYLDLDAEANFLATNETGMNEMLSFMVLSNQMSDQMGIYTALNGIALVLMVLRVLKVLDFQQRMGLVTRTISNAAVDLAHFAILFFVVFSLYGSLAYIIFGSAIVGFSTLPRALNSCFSILLGDISVIDELLVHPNVGAAVIFYYSFIFLAYFILMNILLAILVEAFVEVKRSAEFSKSLPSEVLQILRSSARSLKPFRTENYMADSEIVELLSDWVAESKILEESEKLGRRTFNTEGFSANSEQLQEVLECELARVRQLARGDSHFTEVAAVLGHKATSPLDTILSEDDDDHVSKLAERIAKNVLHRYGTGADVVQSRPRIAPAPSSPGNDRASGRRASDTLNALRRRTLAFAQGAVSPKSRAIRMTRFSQRYASGGKDEQLNAIVDQIIEKRVREETELTED